MDPVAQSIFTKHRSLWLCQQFAIPIGSIYGIYANIGGILMENVYI